MPSGKLWTQRGRYGNDIYLTHERWSHIVAPDNHSEVEPYFHLLREKIRLGRRRQDAYDPNGYQYDRAFQNLTDDNTHLVVCVRFRWAVDRNGIVREEKFVTTAYFQAFEE